VEERESRQNGCCEGFGKQTNAQTVAIVLLNACVMPKNNVPAAFDLIVCGYSAAFCKLVHCLCGLDGACKHMIMIIVKRIDSTA
jgi:hypothetical protein